MNREHLRYIARKYAINLDTDQASPVLGGRSGHLMWKIFGDGQNYAIKQLDPSLDVTDSKVLDRYEITERIAAKFIEQEIPGVSAIASDSKRVICMDDIGYLVYPWIDGHRLGNNEVSEKHALIMARLTAKIHGLKIAEPEIKISMPEVYSTEYIQQIIAGAEKANVAFVKSLHHNKSLLLKLNDLFKDIAPLLTDNAVLSHGDLNQQNVLWVDRETPYLIDWEAIKKIGSTREIVRTSLSWSGIGSEDFSISLYKKMLNMYLNSGGRLDKEHINAAILGAFGNSLFWLLYNVKLCCNSDNLETKHRATNEVEQTLSTIARLDKSAIKLQKVSEGYAV